MNTALGTPPVVAKPPEGSAPVEWRARVLEGLAYVGAALVVAAAATLVFNVWDTLAVAGQTALVASIAALLLVAGLVAGGFLTHGWAAQRAVLSAESEGVRRRLSGVLLTGGAVAAGGALFVGLGVDNEHFLLPGALFGTLLVAVAWWLTGTVVTELALGAGVLVSVASLGAYVTVQEPWPSVTFFVLGLLWAAAATFGLLRHRLTSMAVGLLVAFNMANSASVVRVEGQPPSDWPAYLMLGVLAVVCLVAYARLRGWPFIVGGLLSTFMLLIRLISAYTHGAATTLALLCAGLAILVGAGLLWKFRPAKPGPPEATTGPAAGAAPMGWALGDWPYRAAFAAEPLPAALVDDNTRVLDVNAALAERLHVRPEAVRGSALNVVLADYPGPVKHTQLAEGYDLVTLN